MSTTNGTDGESAVSAGYCSHCGTALASGPFCPGCGRALAGREADTAQMQTAEQRVGGGPGAVAHLGAAGPRFGDSQPGDADVPTLTRRRRFSGADSGSARPPANPPASAEPPRRSRRPVVLAAGALVLVAAAVAAVLLLNRSSSTPDRAATVSPGAVYRTKVAAALRPVAHANRSLAAALLAIHGRNSARARRADSAAQQAVSTARGALSALTPPAAGQRLNTHALQALDHESGYLGAVGATLQDTSSPQRSQVPSLAGNMTSAFETVGAPLAASTGNVTASAGHLVSWAHHRAAVAAAARRARQRRAAAGQSSGSSTTSTAASNPFANGRDCGSGLYAGPSTSCDFAQNVQDAWLNAPGVTNTVEVYSPVTGNTYTMNCSPAGSGITCSGGNNASVSWSF